MACLKGSKIQIMCHAYFSFQVLKNCSKDTSDWSLFSEFAEKRQRHPLGNIELPFQIITHLESPNLADYGTPEGFQEFIYLSQITQAEELRTETEVYRRAMAEVDNETGAGKTMGALYWQLNDIWPGASWTSLDHGGRCQCAQKTQLAKQTRMKKKVSFDPMYNIF